ncbi:hypothetical protein [Metabacillus sp. RGM 3146]|uniref:hypothetical protein n=1 Tax=Metabacillus sp. RGM 3146 TaxID=3401092 RepID=UPI003B9A89F3
MRELKQQFIKVLYLLELQYVETPSPMLELLLKRYQNALNLIQSKPNTCKREEFHISGGVRAYLDSASDYLNPLLGEMAKAEELLEDHLNS